ncbi:MAG: TRAP transporter small permease [Desulfotignum sp.]|jgi:C4-dicarboxylate transporter, DctQ subunit|nr:TRAP transporter small permease [Desulfobacteraceae bacterium]HKK99737.1 TRAP transporter small permease [Desulfotignum sp.]
MNFKSILSNLNQNGERYLTLPLYTLVVIAIFMEVFRRFFLSYSSIWSEEIARYAFIYITWIGAAAAIRERAHIRIDVFLPLLPDKGKAVVFIFGDIITLILSCIALYWSIEPVLTSIHFGSVTHGLRISQAWFLMAVPLGFSMIILRLIQSMKRDISDLKAGRPIFVGKKLFD